MKAITLEMPLVEKCSAVDCSYNRDSSCHAKAITIGDSVTPHCDTFLGGKERVQNTKIIAGVGACKIAGCKYNQDLECAADSVVVGFKNKEVLCQTFVER